MYEELVALLRKKYDKAPMVMEAVDAIEELSRVAEVNAKRAMRWAADAEKAEKAQRWIPVTERLPEDDQRVLAYYGFDRGDGYLGMMFMQVLDYFARDPRPHFQHEGTNGMRVTHWMPLPEPPKEETDEELYG